MNANENVRAPRTKELLLESRAIHKPLTILT